jgi:hypothetical protein
MTPRPMLARLLPLVVTVLVLAGCDSSKPDPRTAAEAFFTLCRDGKIAEAYRSAASQFRIERSQKYFEARVLDLRLKDITAMEWGEIEARGSDVMRLKVKLAIKPEKNPPESGAPDEKLPLTVTLLREGGQWRLLSAKEEVGGRVDEIFAVAERMPDAENFQARQFLDPVSKSVPDGLQLQQLCENALLSFGDAVKREDWSDFFAATSDRWRLRGKTPQQLNYVGSDPRLLEQADPRNTAGRLTIEAIRAAFQSFIDRKVDLSPIKGRPITYDEPARMTSQGVLEVRGRYKDTFVFTGGGLTRLPQRLSFKLEFVSEGSSWKLFGITVSVVAPNGP